WDDKLGPMVGRSYPEENTLSGEEALIVFMGHGVNQEAEIGYSKLQKGLVISYMRPPNCIAVLLNDGENTEIVERNLLRLAPYIDFDSSSWEEELHKAFDTLHELLNESTGKELLNTPSVQKLIKDVEANRIKAFTPTHVLRASVRYPEAQDYFGPDDAEVTRMLKDLEDEDVLESRTFGRRVECRQCGDSNLTIELLCPNCESNDIHKVFTLFCPKCSNQFHAVMAEDIAEVTCLSCKVPVKVGDLAVINVEPLCNHCGTASNDPKIVFRCATCSKHLRGADLLAGTGLAYYPKE
ncbi:MAG: TackOD1 domain-containing metal-binding protein, partial [Candidatus Thorarchaeota archaeon]